MWSPLVVLILILLHVSPISTNGAAIVPPLCAVVPSSQSPRVSKLGPVMFGLLPTHRSLHDNNRRPPPHPPPPSSRPTHWHSAEEVVQTLTRLLQYQKSSFSLSLDPLTKTEFSAGSCKKPNPCTFHKVLWLSLGFIPFYFIGFAHNYF